MKIVRIKTGDEIAYGVVDTDGVTVYQGSPLVVWEATETVIPWEKVRLLAPVIPTKIVGVGKNYAGHAEEMNSSLPSQPLLFIKPTTTMIGPLATIKIPPDIGPVHYEAELAVIVGRVARNVPAEDAHSYILGYTAANDITARDLQQQDGQWTRAKGFDTFCPLGPAIETELDPESGLEVSTRINGELRQQGNTSELVFGVADLMEHISSIMTLLPGDVILTGTPAGVGPIQPGDTVEVEVEGVGILTNVVGEYRPEVSVESDPVSLGGVASELNGSGS